MNEAFHDRASAGRLLAEKLGSYIGCKDAIVLALPRGGVPVGCEVARALGIPLDVFIVRKLGVPGYEELAMGAIASGSVRVLNPQVMRQLVDADRIVGEVTARETAELQRREREYRGGRAPLVLQGRTVILVDDGLATGATMRAAVTALRQRDVAKIVVAVPVGAVQTCVEFEHESDEFICLLRPDIFRAVGQFYRDFSQTTDDEVRALLGTAAETPARM